MTAIYLPMTPTELAAVAVAIASVMGAIATAFFSFRHSASGIKNDVITAYEKRVKQLEDDVESLTRKIDEVKAMLVKRENELDVITKVLQGKNPEAVAYMEESRAFRGRATIMLEALVQHAGLPVPPSLPVK